MLLECKGLLGAPGGVGSALQQLSCFLQKDYFCASGSSVGCFLLGGALTLTCEI